MTPELTRREYFAALTMQAIISDKRNVNLFGIATNVEDCCGEVAVAACRMADELILHLDNTDMKPRSPAYGEYGKVIDLPK